MEYNCSMDHATGKKLKEIRESRGISLEEIALRTRIRIDYLRAVEEGATDALPSRVQMRGFLRSYASALGLNFDELETSMSIVEEPVPEIAEETEEDPGSETKLGGEDSPAKDHEDFPANHTKSNPNQVQDKDPLKSFTLRSQEIFNEIGKRLQQRREILSLSLENIESHTHVRQGYLQAIESGHFEDLPSSVQARGMLANYADFLNLDVDQILLDYADGLQRKRLEKQAEPPKKRLPVELSPTALKLKNFFSLDLLVITALILAFGGFIIWGVNRIMAADSPGLVSTDLPEVADVLLATGSATPELTTPEDETPESGDSADTSPEDETPPLFTPMANDGPINLLVVPLQRAWVEVIIDSETVFVGRLLPGNAYDYSGREQVEILTGNAGALQIFFNDDDIGSVGLIGQVASLIFTENGLILPTPTITPTPTETPLTTPTATMTPSPTSTEAND